MKKTQTFLKQSINRIATACLAVAVFSGTTAMAANSVDDYIYKEEKRILNNASNDVVFKNVNIIPMTEEIVLRKRSVHIKNGKIAAIDDFEDLDIEETTKVINARGKYLIPGLSDMHVHASDTSDRILYLANGVTLIRNMWGGSYNLDEKRWYQQKELLGPELYTTGPIIDGPDTYFTPDNDITILEKPEQAADAIGQMKEEGYDAIKVYSMLSEDVYREILSVSDTLDMPVVGHVPFAVGIKKALTLGQHSIEHLDGYGVERGIISEELMDLTIEADTWNCPTLSLKHSAKNIEYLKQNGLKELKYINPIWVTRWDEWTKLPPGVERPKSTLKESEEFLYKLHQKGGRIVAGTDTGNPYIVAGFSLQNELGHMNQAGLTPWQVLLTATVNAAEMLGYEDRLGTIEVGKDADLVLLRKNPLKNIKNTKKIAGVMVKGTWIPKKSLRRMLKQVKKGYQP